MTAQQEDGSIVRRHTSHVKPYHDSQNVDIGNSRAKRERKAPEYLKDYVQTLFVSILVYSQFVYFFILFCFISFFFIVPC